ncbi:MAG: ribonuclease P protein component [Gammaproteobacteria bacterium]
MKDDVFLSRRGDFLLTARRGKKITGGCWLLRFTPSRRTAARIAVSVSKRFIRRAVRRNRLRRVIREEFRQRWRADLPPMDMIVALAAPPEDETAARRECAEVLAAAVKMRGKMRSKMRKI